MTCSNLFNVSFLSSAVGREYGSREKDGSWVELPNVYYLFEDNLVNVWKK